MKNKQIFLNLDVDGSGGLDFEELTLGLKECFRNVHFTRDDFDILSENGKHLGPTGEFTAEQFQVVFTFTLLDQSVLTRICF